MNPDHHVVGKSTARKRQSQQNGPPRLPVRIKHEPGSSALSDKENSAKHPHQIYGVKQESSSRRSTRSNNNRGTNRKTPRRYQGPNYHRYSSPLEELGNVVYVPRAYKSAEQSLLKREYQNRQPVVKVKVSPQALLNIGFDQKTDRRSAFLNKPNPTSGVKVEYLGYDGQVTEPVVITKHEQSPPQPADEESPQLSRNEARQLGSKAITSSNVLDDVIDMELEYEYCHPRKGASLPDDLSDVDVGELYCSCKSSFNFNAYLE